MSRALDHEPIAELRQGIGGVERLGARRGQSRKPVHHDLDQTSAGVEDLEVPISGRRRARRRHLRRAPLGKREAEVGGTLSSRHRGREAAAHRSVVMPSATPRRSARAPRSGLRPEASGRGGDSPSRQASARSATPACETASVRRSVRRCRPKREVAARRVPERDERSTGSGQRRDRVDAPRTSSNVIGHPPPSAPTRRYSRFRLPSLERRGPRRGRPSGRRS